jgi:3'-5' exoribonuclease
MPKLFVSEIKPNQDIVSLFVAAEKQLRTTRSGSYFLSLKLADKTGEIVGRMWEKAAESAALFNSGNVVTMRGRSELYQDKLQLNIAEISPAPPGSFDPADFLPVCPYDRETMFGQLGKLVSNMSEGNLRRLCEHFLADSSLMARFKLAPAAKTMHHAYLGGLLEHTVSVVTLIYRICNHYPDLDRDLLIAGAFLHDIGKIEEFVYDINIDYSDSGRLIGHMVLGTQMIEEKVREIKGFPLETALLLKHLILSHHGEAQFGAVKLPASKEAFALHLADDLDAKMSAVGRIISNAGGGQSSWTAYDTIFGRHFFRGFPQTEQPTGGDSTSEDDYNEGDRPDTAAKKS